MKLTSAVAVTLLTVSLSSLAMAAAQHSPEEIKTLNDAADALSTKDPDMSAHLRQYAKMESGESQETQTQESANSERGYIRMLGDAAHELDASNPALAQQLRDFANKELGEPRRQTPGSENANPGVPQPSQPAPSSGGY